MASELNGLIPDPAPSADAAMPPSTPVPADAPASVPVSEAPPGAAAAGEDPDLVHPPSHIPGLSPPQETALAALIDGKSAIHAAEMAGVNRSTIYRWQHKDATFAAALNLCRRQGRDEFTTRLSLMQEKVLSVMSNLLEKEDFRVVKLYISFLEKQRIGPGTPVGMLRRFARPHARAAHAAMAPLLKAGRVPVDFEEDAMVRYLNHEDAAKKLEFTEDKGGETVLRED